MSAGTDLFAQMVESASKGAILMYSKEAILKVLSTGTINPGASSNVLKAFRSTSTASWGRVPALIWQALNILLSWL